MPPAEKRMLLLLLGLAVAGQGVRHWATRPGEAPGGVQLLATLTPESPTAQRDSARQQGRALAPGEGPGLLKILAPYVRFSGPAASAQDAARLDINSATVSELDALPGIGPTKARAIVRYR